MPQLGRHDPPSLPGATHRWVGPRGRRIHVTEAGPSDGPTMVLLHGWPQHGWMWREVLPVLAAEGWRVVAPDHRGSGWSDAPAGSYRKDDLAIAIVDALDELGIGRFHLAGHDWGGWVAQLIAVGHPARVDALTLLNISSLWGGRRPPPSRSIRFLYQPIVAAPAIGPWLQGTGAFWRSMQRAGIPAGAIAGYRFPFTDPARRRAASWLYRDFLRFELTAPPPPGRISAPVSALFGMDDPILSLDMLRPIEAHCRSLTIEQLEGCGHFVVDERPDAVAGHLLAFHGAHRSGR